MTYHQYRVLKGCCDAEAKGNVASGPENWTFPPLQGASKELVELGYLRSEDFGGEVIGLYVTDAGRDVAHAGEAAAVGIH